MKKQKTQSKIIVALTAVVLLLVALSATLTFAYFTATNNATSTEMQFGNLGINTATLTVGQDDGTCKNVVQDQTTVFHTLVPGCTIDLSGTIGITGNIDALLRAQLTATAYQTKRFATEDDVTANLPAGVAVGDLISIKATDSGAKVYRKNTTTNRIEEVTIESPDTIATHQLALANANYGAEFLAIESETTLTGAGTSFAQQVFNLADTATYSGWTYDAGYYYYNYIVNGGVTNSATFATSFTLPASTMGNEWQGAYVQFGIVVEAIQAEHLTNVDDSTIAIAKDSSTLAFTGVTVTTTGVSPEATTTTIGQNEKTMADVIAVLATAKAWDAEPDGTWSDD